MQNQMTRTEAGGNAAGWMRLLTARTPESAVENKQNIIFWKSFWTSAWQD